jgi:hypothetical protein
VAAAVGAPLHAASLQVVFRQEAAAADDISALAVNPSGSYLAAADDAGEASCDNSHSSCTSKCDLTCICSSQGPQLPPCLCDGWNGRGLQLSGLEGP